jgi:hypothetical protein
MIDAFAQVRQTGTAVWQLFPGGEFMSALAISTFPPRQMSGETENG